MSDTINDKLLYPISAVIELQGPQGWIRKQEATALPRLRPNQRFIAAGPEGYELLPENIRLTGKEPVIHRSGNLIVVEMGHRTVQFSVEVQAGAGTERYEAIVQVACRVFDPVAVAQEHITDVGSLLTPHVADHLSGLSGQLGDNTTRARRVIAADIQAKFTIDPPVIPGLDFRFLSCRVVEPREVLELIDDRQKWERQREIDDRRHRAQQEQLRRDAELEQAKLDDRMAAARRLAERTASEMEAMAANDGAMSLIDLSEKRRSDDHASRARAELADKRKQELERDQLAREDMLRRERDDRSDRLYEQSQARDEIEWNRQLELGSRADDREERKFQRDQIELSRSADEEDRKFANKQAKLAVKRESLRERRQLELEAKQREWDRQDRRDQARLDIVKALIENDLFEDREAAESIIQDAIAQTFGLETKNRAEIAPKRAKLDKASDVRPVESSSRSDVETAESEEDEPADDGWNDGWDDQ